MNRHATVTSITLAAALLASSAQLAFAQEATPETSVQTSATKSRAEVRAEISTARAAGELAVPSEYGIMEQPFVSTLSRAEVLADLRAYRDSGLSELQQGEAPDLASPQYVAAQAKYAQLRSSPVYASSLPGAGAADAEASE